MAFRPPTPRVVQVPPLHELRIELEKGESCSIKLLSGTAEIFGFELLPGFDNPLAEECKAAIFTWTGCDLEISPLQYLPAVVAILWEERSWSGWYAKVAQLINACRPSTEYVAEETPLPSHYNAHLALEQRRATCQPPPSFLPWNDPVRAQPLHLQPDETYGPRVLVIGEAGSGKSTLCKSLINWAIRAGKARRDGDWTEYGTGRKVLFVNLDLSDGAFTVPGTFSAAPINHLLPTTTPILPFGSTHSTALPPLAAPSLTATTWEPQPNLNALAPMHNGLSFFYGSTEWGKNEGLTESLFAKLGDCVRRRIDQSNDEGIWRGGMVVDTPAAFTKKENYKWITRAVREFEINVLLVVGNERLQVEMSKLMSTNKTVTVIRVPKNSGASGLDTNAKRRLQAAQIHSYFYGGPSVSFGALAPHSMSIPFPILSINRVGEDAFVPLSALPIGHTRSIKDTQLVELSPLDSDASGEIMNKLCALPQLEGARRHPKKRKRTPTPPPVVPVEEPQPKVEEKAKEPSEQPEEPVPGTMAALAQPEGESSTAAASTEAAAGPSMHLENAGTGAEETNSAVKKEEEDQIGTLAAASVDEAQNQNGTVVPNEGKKEEDTKPDMEDDDDPYADYTEEEKQQLVEDAIEDSEIASSPVLGFVHISNIDSAKHKYTVLSPLPGKLPRTKLIVGQVEWVDV